MSLTTALLITLAACASENSGARAGSGAPAGANTGNTADAAVSSSVLPRPTGEPPMQANRAAPDSRAVNLRPVNWTRTEAGEGRQLLVHYTVGGRSECGLLGRVQVAETATSVTVTVYLGQAPGADCSGAQPMIAADYVATVTLGQPLGSRTVVDGSRS